MDIGDKLIPLLGLAGVGAFLLFLLRLAKNEQAAPPRIESAVEKAPIATPVSVPVATPVVVNAPPPEVAAPAAGPPAPIVIAKKTPSSPVHAVIELLKKKDSLTTAFLLHEILGPPVSKR
jgi:hypothetical protein